MSVRKRGLISRAVTDAAAIDGEPILASWSWQVDNKVGFDETTFKVPKGLVEQTENALDAVDRCFQKAKKSLCQFYEMRVLLSTMRDKPLVADIIRKRLSACSRPEHRPEQTKELRGVTFKKVTFEDAHIKIMMVASEYHGR